MLYPNVVRMDCCKQSNILSTPGESEVESRGARVLMTDAEKVLSMVIELLYGAQLFTKKTMNAQTKSSIEWQYWSARYDESKAISDYFADQNVESLIAMYDEEIE